MSVSSILMSDGVEVHLHPLHVWPGHHRSELISIHCLCFGQKLGSNIPLLEETLKLDWYTHSYTHLVPHSK